MVASSPLRSAAFRALWLAATVSFLGSFVQEVGERWVILDLTKSPLPSAMLSTVFVTASLVAMMPSGILADRFDRRVLVMVSQGLQGLTAAVVSLLVWTGHVSPALLLVSAGAMGLGMALGTPAWNALIPELVSRELVAEAIALNAVAFNIARAIGPAIGGVVLSVFGAAASFALNAASFAAVIVALALHRGAPREPQPASPVTSAFAEPLRVATRDPGVRAAMLAMLVFTTGASMVYALAPAFGKITLGVSATEYGLMFTAMGAGAIAGTWALRPLRRRISPRSVVVLTSTVYALSAFAMSRAEDRHTAMLLFFPAGAGWTGTFSSLSTLVQVWTPDRLRARIVALYVVGHFGTWAIGSTLGGAIAERASVRLAMLVGAAICGLGALLTTRLPLPADFIGQRSSLRPPPPELETAPISTPAP